METIQTGVTPVHDIDYGVCLTGRPTDLKTAEYTTVTDAENLAISIDGQIEEWKPMDQKGWTRRLMTAKSLGLSFGGKRNYGDPGNDYIASKAMKTGQDANSAIRLTFPNGDKLYMPCVINVTSMAGDATAVNALEWEALSDGKPTYVEYETV